MKSRMEQYTSAKVDNVISSHYRIGAYLYDAIVFALQLFVGGVSRWRRTVIELVDPAPGENILELCCGTGSVSLRLAKRGGLKIWASDLSSDQVAVARFKARIMRRDVAFSVQDASNTCYPGAFFDKVVISGALHEITKERRRGIYREVIRVMKPDGAFIVSEPNRPDKGWGRECFESAFGKWNREHDTVYELIDGGLEQELQAFGFRRETSRLSNFGIFKSIRCVVKSGDPTTY